MKQPFPALHMTTSDEFTHHFGELEAHLTLLDLSWSDLYTRSGGVLARAFAAIGFRITTLDLSWNDFYQMPALDLARALKAVPPWINTFYLTGNDLFEFPGAGLGHILAAISPGVKVLSLSRNGLGKAIAADLAQALMTLKRGIELLDLSRNEFYRMDKAELCMVLAAIPGGVKTLNLSGNKLERRTGEELDDLLESLPVNVTSVILASGKIVDMDDWRHKRYQSRYVDARLKLQAFALQQYDVELTEKINELILAVADLHNKKDSILDLIDVFRQTHALLTGALSEGDYDRYVRKIRIIPSLDWKMLADVLLDIRILASASGITLSKTWDGAARRMGVVLPAISGTSAMTLPPVSDSGFFNQGKQRGVFEKPENFASISRHRI